MDQIKSLLENVQLSVQKTSRSQPHEPPQQERYSDQELEEPQKRKTVVDRSNYWKTRTESSFYKSIKSIIRQYCPQDTCTKVLDVGSYSSNMLNELEWLTTRIATDINPTIAGNFKDTGITYVAGDFMKKEEFAGEKEFDLVLCTQVVEHLSDPASFIRKMMKIGDRVLVSTTFNLPHGVIEGHVQDPIDLDKFVSWFGDDPTSHPQVVQLMYDRKTRYFQQYGAANIIGYWQREELN